MVVTYCPNGAQGIIFGVGSSPGGEDFYDVNPAGNVVWTGVLLQPRPYGAAPDGSGGAVLGAHSELALSIFGCRLDGTGAVPSGWSPGGNLVSTEAGQRFLDAIAADGTRGTYFAWTDYRVGRNDLYASHLTESGSRAAGWTAQGDPVASPIGARDPAVMIADGGGGAIMVWSDSRNGNRDLFAQRITSDIPVPVLASLQSADARPDCVRLVWHAPTDASHGFRIDRRDRDSDWSHVADSEADGMGRITYEDRDVTPGASYGYRIARLGDVPETFVGEVWVDVPATLALSLETPRPHPVVGDLDVSFVLPSAMPATLELFDLAGRVILSREVGSLGPGRHVVHVAGRDLLEPGVHFLRLKQGKEARLTKVAVIR